MDLSRASYLLQKLQIGDYFYCLLLVGIFFCKTLFLVNLLRSIFGGVDRCSYIVIPVQMFT